MIHGAFCGGWVFEDFAEPFRAAGHKVLTPDLPGHGPKDAPDSVAGRSMGEYADAIAKLIRAQPRPPLVVGHSMGGLVALMAASRAPTAGVIGLAPSSPWGVTPSTVEEGLSAVALYALGAYWAQSIEPLYAAARRYNLDRLPSAAAKSTFARMRPESGRALFEVLNWWLDPCMTTMIHPSRIGAPMLAISGDRDVINPPSTVADAARRRGAEMRTMPGMSHWLPAEPGWRNVADLCLDWIGGRQRQAAA